MGKQILIPDSANSPLQFEPVIAIPSFEMMKRMLDFDKDTLIEHVNVLYNGKHAHMFVDEEGLLKGLHMNIFASTIYWQATINQHDKGEIILAALSPIAGPALLYEDCTWE